MDNLVGHYPATVATRVQIPAIALVLNLFKFSLKTIVSDGMFFEKKKDVDIQELKRAIDEDRSFHTKASEKAFSTPETGLEPTFDTPIQRQAPEKPRESMTPELTARHMRESRPSAPLFVKVEKYKEALMKLQDIKSLVSGTKQLFTLLNDIETIRSETLKLLRATLQRVERNVVELNSGLLRPPNLPELPGSSQPAKTTHTEEALADLQEQVTALKKELKKFE